MKIPTSSSIFLATLAISSSTSCLAAPTGDASAGHDLTSSSSHGQLDSAAEGHAQPRAEDSGYAVDIEARDLDLLHNLKGVLSGLPILGPPISHILDSTNGNPSQEEMTALQSAADEVTRALGSAANSTLSNAPTPVQGAAGEVASHLPAPIAGALSDDQNGGSSSAVPSQTASAAAADAPSSAAQPSGSASPSMPPGPPNTPALPVDV